jgi:two-component system nitrogen regulation response regulator GlnG
LTISKDLASVPRAVGKRGFDLVLIEAKRGTLHELAEMHRAIDPSRTAVLSGSRAVLRQAYGLVQAMRNGHGRLVNDVGQELSLEDYIESKLKQFVKGMKNASVRNLHPMFMSAVERPLIALALKETNGNQIQAAQLLGMNRNTLRKKIVEHRIPVKRERMRKA